MILELIYLGLFVLWRQKAFWDQRDVSQDDNFAFEKSHIPLPNIIEEAPHFVGVANTSCGTISDDVVPMMDAQSVSLSALSKTRECVLCRSKVLPEHQLDFFLS
jgi:hypothetical protein